MQHTAGGTPSHESDGTAQLRNGTNNSGTTTNNAFGRLAPAVSVGAKPLVDRAEAAQHGGGGSGGFSYDLENGGGGAGAGGGGSRGGGTGVEDLVEHDYGYTGGQAEVRAAGKCARGVGGG